MNTETVFEDLSKDSEENVQTLIPNQYESIAVLILNNYTFIMLIK